MRAILGDATSQSQIEALTIRARCFYYSRKHNNTPIDFEAYKAHYLSSHRNLTDSNPSAGQAPAHTTQTSTGDSQVESTPQYPQTFASLVQLIQSGAPIPGIKEIPPTVLTGQATVPTASKRRKPWETAGADSEKENATGATTAGTFGDRRDEYIEQDLPEISS